MDLLYSSLKVISMIATGAFGALGLLTKYKDDQGKITKWGKVAIGGILISSGISLGLYALEASRAKASAIQATADANATKTKLEVLVANAQTMAVQQERSLEETKTLKAGLKESLATSNDIAKGMGESLATQQSVLGGNKKILSGVTDTIKSQGEVLNKTGINLLALLSKDNPVQEASWWLELKRDPNQPADVFEFLFSRILREYKSIVVGTVYLHPYLGISARVEYSYQGEKLVKSYPYKEPKDVPPEIQPPPFLSESPFRHDTKDKNAIFIMSQKTTAEDKDTNAAIAYRDLLEKNVVGALSLRLEKEFDTKEEARTFALNNKSLEPMGIWTVLGTPTRYQVKFKLPKRLKDAFFSYWRTSFQRAHMHLSLVSSAYLMISCEVNIREMIGDDSSMTISFQPITDPKIEVGIREA